VKRGRGLDRWVEGGGLGEIASLPLPLSNEELHCVRKKKKKELSARIMYSTVRGN